MATTRELLFGSGNSTKNEIDLIDVGALILLPMFASFLFGFFTVQVNVFGGYDLTGPIWTFSTVDVSVAFLVVVFSAAWIIGTNLLNQQKSTGRGGSALSDAEHRETVAPVYAHTRDLRQTLVGESVTLPSSLRQHRESALTDVEHRETFRACDSIAQFGSIEHDAAAGSFATLPRV